MSNPLKVKLLKIVLGLNISSAEKHRLVGRIVGNTMTLVDFDQPITKGKVFFPGLQE